MMTSVLNFRYLFTTIFIIIGASLWLTYPRYYDFNGNIFGTYYKVIVIGPKYAINKNKIETSIKSRLNHIDLLFSTYRPDSEIMTLNRAPLNEKIEVSREVIDLIQLSKTLTIKLDKAWDPTIVPVSKKYGFDTVTGITGSVVGIHHINIINDEYIVKDADIALDLSSIAKGYAVDELLKLVKKNRIKGAYIDIGGEIRTAGSKSDNKKWGIGIQSPVNKSELIQVLYTNDFAIATSGNYLNYTQKGNQVIGHILDPRSQSPIDHELLSVSIVANECVIADALATGIFVMGLKLGVDWLNKNPQIPALLIYNENEKVEVKMLNGFDRFLDPSKSLSF